MKKKIGHILHDRKIIARRTIKLLFKVKFFQPFSFIKATCTALLANPTTASTLMQITHKLQSSYIIAAWENAILILLKSFWNLKVFPKQNIPALTKLSIFEVLSAKVYMKREKAICKQGVKLSIIL